MFAVGLIFLGWTDLLKFFMPLADVVGRIISSSIILARATVSHTTVKNHHGFHCEAYCS